MIDNDIYHGVWVGIAAQLPMDDANAGSQAALTAFTADLNGWPAEVTFLGWIGSKAHALVRVTLGQNEVLTAATVITRGWGGGKNAVVTWCGLNEGGEISFPAASRADARAIAGVAPPLRSRDVQHHIERMVQAKAPLRSIMIATGLSEDDLRGYLSAESYFPEAV